MVLTVTQLLVFMAEGPLVVSEDLPLDGSRGVLEVNTTFGVVALPCYYKG